MNGEGCENGVKEAARFEPRSYLADWGQSKWLAVAELVTVALIFVADSRHLVPFSKTPFLLLFAWISLWVRKVGWRGVGLSRYRTWAITLRTGIAVGLALEALELFVTQPFLVRALHKQADLEVFHALNGNLKLTLIFPGIGMDCRSIRGRDGLPRLPDEPRGRPVEPDSGCLDCQPDCRPCGIWAWAHVPGSDWRDR